MATDMPATGDAQPPKETALHRPSVILTSFDIYESRTRLVIIGSNEAENHYCTLHIDRTADTLEGTIQSTSHNHTSQSIAQLVQQLQTQGIKLLVAGVCSLLGFVRFTKGLYISLVTRRKPVALLGGHYIYHVEDTRLLSITFKPERTEAEDRFIATFKNVDLTKNFYYSHTYDITRSLQQNMRGRRPYQSMFVWNYQMLVNARVGLGVGAEWTVALVHGYIDQSKLCVLGRDVFVTLIARRSRVFAGVRYLKRGVNDAGYVANDVETEQIVNTMETTALGASHASYLQHRGSIPLFWSQDTSGITPKPPIEINVRDPYFVEAARHFSSLFARYGAPVIVLSLIKTKERTKRESALGEEFSEGLHYLNQFLPRGRKIRYLAWDMSRAKKNRQEDVLAILEVIAEETLALTGFFHSGSELYTNYQRRLAAGDQRPRRMRPMRQSGVVRSNCIDCLDRTNAAQSIIGKVALAHQLYELGIIAQPQLSFNTDAAMIIEEMYHDLGNTIALQYGGSHLVNTVQTYRRNTNWRSHSRDIVEALRRYYSNSLLDMERQEAITYFVEKSIFPECAQHQTASTSSINNTAPNSGGSSSSRPNQVGKPIFRKWWNTLKQDDDDDDDDDYEEEKTDFKDTYWNEYYRPHSYTSLDSLFVNNLNSSASLHHGHTNVQNTPSPFADRSIDPTSSQYNQPRFVQQEPKWLKTESEEYIDPTQISRQDIYERVCNKMLTPQILQPLGIGGWITDGITGPLQEPKVCQSELEEYEKYVGQFNNLQKWIVPPSTVLYSDYLKNQQTSVKINPNHRYPTPIGSITQSTILYTDNNRQRSQTPLPQNKTDINNYSSRLFNTKRESNRARSNTTMLWKLWSQPNTDENKTNNIESNTTSSLGIHGGLRRRDRSRSLDLGNKLNLPLNSADLTMDFLDDTTLNNNLVMEPRVTEQDLRIYQDYVKMRKAYNGQI